MTSADDKQPEEKNEATEAEKSAEPKAAKAKADEKAKADKPKAEKSSKAKAAKPKAEKKAEEAKAEKPKRTAKPKAKEDEDAKPEEAKAEEPGAKQPAARKAEADGKPVVRAHARYVRTSARKARLVCDHIRGKSVPEARAILQHTTRRVAEDWRKLLESAVANAEHNHELVGDDLVVAYVAADEGPTLKRWRPRAHGRATRINKRTAHLSIALTPKES
jgi:ribosomal protein L22